MFSSLSSVLSLSYALFLRAPWRIVCMCITRRFLDISVPFQRYLRFSHALNILRQEKVGVAIRNFRVSVTITVTVSTIILPFTDSRAHTFKKLFLKFHLDRLNRTGDRSADLGKVSLKSPCCMVYHYTFLINMKSLA